MSDNQYKQITQQTYNDIADAYVERDQHTIAETPDVAKALEDFAELLQPGTKVLDLGSGGGRDSRRLLAREFAVTGVDYSEDLVKHARKLEPRIEYKVIDFEEDPLPEGPFDAIWSNAALHHIPKSNLLQVLEKCYQVLKPGGVLFVKVRKGTTEEIQEEEKFGTTIRRFFASYEPEELGSIVGSSGFSILKTYTTTNDKWVDVFAKKR